MSEAKHVANLKDARERTPRCTSERILRAPELCRKVGRSRVTIWRDERAGLFPKRLRLGPNAIGWLESEVDAWLEERAAERDRAA